VDHYEYSTINSHHKVLVNLQASNMDALKSKSCLPFSQNCVFTFVARRCRKSSLLAICYRPSLCLSVCL